jgi:Skp family chaperone for outer membrane proteins
MKKYLLLFFIFLLLCLGSFSFAQSAADKKDKIQAMRVAFITNQLDLSSKEAQTFWPIYNEYQDKLDAIREARRKEMGGENKRNTDAMTDKEVETMIDNDITLRLKEAELTKTYHFKFKTVLPVKKVAKLYRAEDDFKRELLKQIKK